MSDISQLERDSRIRTTAQVVLTFIAVAVSLYFLRPVLLPFVLALFIASGLVPVLNAVQKYLESSRPMAIFVTAMLSISVTIVLWVTIWVSVSGLLNSSDTYRDGFYEMLGRIGTTLQTLYPLDEPESKTEPGNDSRLPPVPRPSTIASGAPEVARLSPGDGLRPDNDDGDAVAEFESVVAAAPDGAERFEPFMRFFADRMESIIRLVANELFAVFSSGLLVMIFLFFLLLGGSHVQLPEDNIWRDVDMHVRQYIVAKTLISAVTGFVFGAVLWLFGVPLAFVLGLLAFLLNYIPNLGPIIASLLPVPLVWMLVEATWARQAAIDAGTGVATDADVDFGLTKGITAIVLAAAVQFISGNVVEPKIMGEQFRLHPIAILLSLMFWYMIWGLVGAFLAVPITSALKIMLGQLDATRPAADLLEGNLSILAKREQATTTA